MNRFRERSPRLLSDQAGWLVMNWPCEHPQVDAQVFAIETGGAIKLLALVENTPDVRRKGDGMDLWRWLLKRNFSAADDAGRNERIYRDFRKHHLTARKDAKG
ncbi:MAG: hypothetical protein M1839_007240 [Geoglossum umbratile]|nr:MAG: hypothetical protein M1839_007240 [Geoglossum umbratile]